MRLRLYRDTSVFRAYSDERTPDRRADTREFWDSTPGLELVTSEMATRELSRVREPSRREELLAVLGGVVMHPLTDEMVQSAGAYAAAGLFGEAIEDDALHVAAAVLTGCSIPVSWNYKHLVNRRRRAGINDVNVASGLPTIEIVSPPEVGYASRSAQAGPRSAKFWMRACQRRLDIAYACTPPTDTHEPGSR